MLSMEPIRKLKLDELGRLGESAFRKSEKIPIVVILDNLRSALNIGSILRSCDAFRIQKVVLTGICAIPPHKEILKTAIGASRTVDWEYVEDVYTAISSYKEQGFEIIGIEQTDQSLPLHSYRIETNKKYVVVFGNEVDGIDLKSLQLVDQALEITQYGTKHSLNVAVCAGIVLWQLSLPFLREVA